MLSRAHSLIDNYKDNGVSSDRILIRLPATWQGIQAAKWVFFHLQSATIDSHPDVCNHIEVHAWTACNCPAGACL